MKNWYGVGPEGRIVSVEVRAQGWPDECDWSDPNCADTRVTRLREGRNQNGITEFVSWDCPCPVEVRVCNCHNERVANFRVENGEWVEKPDTQMVIDGTALSPSSNTKRFTPVVSDGSVTFKVTGPGVPDGATVAVGWAGLDPAHEDNPVVLTFAGGETPEITLNSPMIGGLTRLGIAGGYIKPNMTHLRGIAP